MTKKKAIIIGIITLIVIIFRTCTTLNKGTEETFYEQNNRTEQQVVCYGYDPAC